MLLGKTLRNTLLFSAIIHLALPYYTIKIKIKDSDSETQKDTLTLINNHLANPLPGLIYTLFIVLISTLLGNSIHVL